MAALTIAFDSDFADLFEVRGMHRPARGRIEKKVIAPNKVAFVYTGLDEKVRETVLTFHPAPDELSVGEAKYSLSLAPFNSLLSVRVDIVRGRGRRRANRRDPILSRVIAVAPDAACLR